MIYDLIVVGGGINGAAIARDAALRGLQVCVLEKNDFGSGASTKTSKLAHGGLRYLEGLEIGLVHESLQERSLLLKNAPHLVQALPFVLPVYANDRHPLWQVNMGLYLYDFLARKGGLPKHKKLTAKEVIQCFPQLKDKALKGGCLYYDAQMKDNRLLIETLVAAEQAGAKIHNYTPVERFLKEHNTRVCGVVVKDCQGEETALYAKVVVNATGAWINEIAIHEAKIPLTSLSPTKGVHIVIPQICPHQALFLQAPQDGRVFFVIPWENQSLVGTTDTFYKGTLDCVEPNSGDITYLLEALKSYFPSLPRPSIQGAFAGLRPLLNDTGNNAPSDISRRHIIQEPLAGLICVVGGKYTTHRKIAEETVDKVIKDLGEQDSSYLPCSTASTPLPGALTQEEREGLLKVLVNEELTAQQAAHLLENYGKNAWKIVEIIRQSPEEKQQICPLHPHIFAELVYAIDVEHVKKPEDWFCRRTSIAYVSTCKGKNCYELVAKKLQTMAQVTCKF